jgi:hypothetical protein
MVTPTLSSQSTARTKKASHTPIGSQVAYQERKFKWLPNPRRLPSK